jgi:hypothetical protein
MIPLGEHAEHPPVRRPFCLLSSIRTMTVGSGIAPDLLTLPFAEGARGLRKASFWKSLPIPPVGSFTPP